MFPSGSRGAKLVQAALQKVNAEKQNPENSLIDPEIPKIDSTAVEGGFTFFVNENLTDNLVYEYEPDAELLSTISSVIQNFNKPEDHIIDNINPAFVSDANDGANEFLLDKDVAENENQDDNNATTLDTGTELNLILNFDTGFMVNEYVPPVDVEEGPEKTEESDSKLATVDKEPEKIEETETHGATDDKQNVRKGKLQPSEKQSKKRVLGLPDLGCKRKGNEIIDKNVKKEARSIKTRCTHVAVKPKSERTFLCGLFSEEVRDIVLKEFWKIKTWPEKKMYVKGLVSTRNILRRRKSKENQKKKDEGHDIFLPKADGIKVKVCRTFFINTLGIGEDTFKRWVKRETSDEESNTENDGDNDLRVRSGSEDGDGPPTKRSKVQVGYNDDTKEQTTRENNLQTFIDLLPKVPSHYCRSTSKKIYLESTFRSRKHLREVYTNWCTEQQLKPFGKTFFKQFLEKKNIAIHMPRKDQCDVCCSYRTKQVSEEDYQNHLKKKDKARAAKNREKESAKEKKLVLTMDLQSVLLCPKLLASKHYFKTKLQIHNFTIYVLNNKDVTLYVWHESNGGVTANEFTSCVVDFICSQKNYDHFVLISDGCGHQNRNRILSSALSDVAVKRSITIEQLYLEKGHTMMEADSVHATLEKYFKPPINSPADYYARMRVARPSQPYNVKVVDFSFFKNFEDVNTNLASLRPGQNRPGEPVVMDIRTLRYLPNGEIFYKINHSDEFSKIPQRKLFDDSIQLKQLYNKPIPITESKYLHLQELKSGVEVDHHAFYDNLIFKSDETKKKKTAEANVSTAEKMNTIAGTSKKVLEKSDETKKKKTAEANVSTAEKRNTIAGTSKKVLEKSDETKKKKTAEANVSTAEKRNTIAGTSKKVLQKSDETKKKKTAEANVSTAEKRNTIAGTSKKVVEKSSGRIHCRKNKKNTVLKK